MPEPTDEIILQARERSKSSMPQPPGAPPTPVPPDPSLPTPEPPTPPSEPDTAPAMLTGR